MRVLSVSWDAERDITKLKFNDEFLTSDWIVRADVLKDLLGDITDLYNLTLDEMTNPVLVESFGHSKDKPTLESVK